MRAVSVALLALFWFASSAIGQDNQFRVLDLEFRVLDLDLPEMEVAGAVTDLEMKETETEIRIALSADVLFDFDRATLTPGAREKLSKLSGVLIAYPGTYRIDVEGHTDAVGSNEYNESLSQGRAQSVASYIGQAGVPADRIRSVAGFGETRPVASNDNAAGRQQNRRVELVIADLDQ